MNQVEESYDNLAGIYDSEYTSDLCKAEEREVSKLLGLDASRILDAGCGTGLLMDMRPGLVNYFGVDVSTGMLDQARRKHPGRMFYQDDAWTTTRHEPIHQLVSLFGSPSYSPIADVIAGTKRHLRRGGKFFLMPYARGRLRTAWKYNNAVAIHSNLWYTYQARQWRQLLTDAGATDVVVRGFNLLGSKKLIRYETPLAKRFPDRCQYLFITGVM